MVFRYSAIGTSYYCQQKYYLEYVKGLKAPIDSLDLVFGNAIHSAIAAHFLDGDAMTTFTTYWDTVKDQELQKSRFDYTQLKDIGEKLIAKWVRMHSSKFEPLHVEKRVKYTIGKFELEGTPDFVGYYEGKLCVVDWKTTGYRYDKRKALVDEQVWCYLEAVKQNYLIHPTHVVYAPFIKDGAVVQAPIVCEVTPERVQEKLDNVKLVLHDLSTREVFTKNRMNCLKCNMYSHCYKESE